MSRIVSSLSSNLRRQMAGGKNATTKQAAPAPKKTRASRTKKDIPVDEHGNPLSRYQIAKRKKEAAILAQAAEAERAAKANPPVDAQVEEHPDEEPAVSPAKSSSKKDATKTDKSKNT